MLIVIHYRLSKYIHYWAFNLVNSSAQNFDIALLQNASLEALQVFLRRKENVLKKVSERRIKVVVYGETFLIK